MEFNIKNFYDENSSRDNLRAPFFNNTKSVLYAANPWMCIQIPKKSDLFSLELGHEIVDQSGLLMNIEKLFSRWENVGDYQIITDFKMNNEIKECPNCRGSGLQKCNCEFCQGHKCGSCSGYGFVNSKDFVEIGEWKRHFNPDFIDSILNLPNVRVFDTVKPEYNEMPWMEPIYFSFGPESECKGLLMGMRP